MIGLGRFGGALATELVRSGTEVLGIDTDEDIVQSLNGVLTHVVRADSTKQVALEQLGVVQFDRVVVGIGSDIQASILTTSLLKRMGVRSIWAKAISEQHGLILEQLGIEHVIFPEADMGRRVAHLVRGAMLDYVEFDRDLVVAKTVAPQEIVGKTLEQAAVRRRYGVTIVKVRSADSEWQAAGASSVITAGDLLIVIGPVEQTEKFAALT
ncbi:potassium channel family protein [Microbacterium sp. 179-I 1D1 NHS]|uniref:potassium channel family protein n=1 Tax=Microbacterium sp. 179-I 1D1 NHS TaxID=3374298 RepID=UPI00387A5AD3